MRHGCDTRWVALLTITLASVGCQSLGGGKDSRLVDKIDIPDGVPWKREKEPEPGIPSRVIATWTDGVLQQPGSQAKRGFGGRLYFYQGQSEEPIMVDGQLVIYAFDETDRDPTDNRPTRRYVYPADQFAKHFSESEIGPSYSVWLSWDESGGPSKDISLIARFEPRGGGKLIVSEQSSGRLPGQLGAPRVETQIANNQLTPTVQQTSHNAEVPAALLPAEPQRQQTTRRMETTTIKLPRR